MVPAHNCTTFYRKIASKFAVFLLTVAITQSAIALPTMSSNTDKKQIDALLIKQTSFYYGDHTIYLTRDAIKDVFEKNGTISIARAPDWKVITFNPRTKVFVEHSKHAVNGVLQKPFALMGENDMHDKPLIPTSTTTFKGYSAQKYVTPAAFSRNAVQLHKEKKVISSELGRIDMINLIVPVGDEQRAILAKLFDLPPKPGITVEFIKTSLDGTTEPHLLTTLIQKVKVSDAEMRMAPNYKRVKEHAQLLNYSESTNDGLLKMMIGDEKKSH